MPSYNDDDIVVDYEIPSWAGRPPLGYHLDVVKSDKLIQKLMIDEKGCYYFGRNPKQCDFVVDHASCSRVHACLLYHKLLQRFFLVDLASSHGTFVGRTCLGAKEPQCVDEDSSFHFGASRRCYVLRACPGQEQREAQPDPALVHLPQHEQQLENLTEYNTALNRRIASIGMTNEDHTLSTNQQKNVSFTDDDQIINPEDVDPTVGRFRNMVATAVIPAKKMRSSCSDLNDLFSELSGSGSLPKESHNQKSLAESHHRSIAAQSTNPVSLRFAHISTKLGLSLPNPAPDVDVSSECVVSPLKRMMYSSGAEMDAAHSIPIDDSQTGPKKKYAKEAWPGKKPANSTRLL